MKIIIAGSRDFHDYKILRNKLMFLTKYKNIEIVSGTAR